MVSPCRHTVEERVAQFAPRCDPLWRERCRLASIPWPPERLLLVGLKAERRLEIHAADRTGRWRWLHVFKILGASGGPGPKRCEGDRQVPEGVYGIASLNPNSRYHVSLRIDYPNALDREQGQAEGTAALGGDIMIHGGEASVGCLALGDPAAEELFFLATRHGIGHLRIVLLPHDFRIRPDWPDSVPDTPWTRRRYEEAQALLALIKGE